MGPIAKYLGSRRVVVSTKSHLDNLSGVSDLETNLADLAAWPADCPCHGWPRSIVRGERCLGRNTILPVDIKGALLVLLGC